MNSQYNDIKKVFLKTGPYVLSDEYKLFMLSVDAWSKKTNAEKDEYFNKSLGQRIMRLNTVQPRKYAGKKIGQKQRKRPHRTMNKPTK